MAIDFLGYGLLSPFKRDLKNDFSNSGQDTLIRSCIRNILGTKKGELRHRPEFGSDLHRLKHLTSSDVDDLAQHYTVEALVRWEPRIEIRAVDITRSDNGGGDTLFVTVFYVNISTNVPNNQVVSQITIPVSLI